jgi:hypothetical protein
VIRARIGTLRLRIPAGDRRFAKTVATAVASRLALHIGDNAGSGAALAQRVDVPAPRSAAPGDWANSIAGSIAGGNGARKGRR